MAVSNEEINAYLAANPGMNDAGIASAMDQFKVSPEQMAQATGFGLGDVQSRYNAATTPPQTAGITSLAPLYTGLTAQSKPEDIASAYSQFTQGAGGNTQANQTQAIDYLTGLGIAQPTITSAYSQFLQPPQAAATTAAPTAPVFDPSKGVFQTVYDPKTGQEFISPAQAFASGVTDYVTEMPMKLEFLNETSKKAVTDAMAGGATFEQALARLGGQFGMSGKDFYNYEVQGGIRSNNTLPIREAVATASGGLKPDELVAKLQAYRDKPPTTAQELRDQQALYADYANRYANSSWNYANMGGVAQDYSLKPQDYLKTQFTGYSDPLNQLLSNMNQMTPDFTTVQKQLTKNPVVVKALEDIYKLDPNSQLFGSGDNILRAKINHLSSEIDRIGEKAALRNFYLDQQNLVGFGSDDRFGGQNMGTPQWAELQRKIMSQTPVASDDKWNDMASRTSGPRDIKELVRDPYTKQGVGLISDPDTGYHQGIGFYDRNGQLLRTSLLRPEDILKNAEEFGFDMSDTGALGRVLKTAKVDINPAEMAKPEWLDEQIKHLDWQNRNASFSSPLTTQSRLQEIRQTHEMAKRMLDQPTTQGILSAFKDAKNSGLSEEDMKKSLGEDKYKTYKSGLARYAETGIASVLADNKLSLDEASDVVKFGRDYGYDAKKMAELTGTDQKVFDSIYKSYDDSSKQVIKDMLGAEDVKTQDDKIIRALALEDKFGFTDDQFAKALGFTPEQVKGALDPVRNFSTDLTNALSNTDSTLADAKKIIASSKENSVINKLYGDKLAPLDAKIAEIEDRWKDFQGVEPMHAQRVFDQIGNQRKAIGDDRYFRGVFADPRTMAATLAKKGIDTLADIGQKEKFEAVPAEKRYTTKDGAPVEDLGDGSFYGPDGLIPKSQVKTNYGYTEYETSPDGESQVAKFVPLSDKDVDKDGNYQKSIGKVAIDKDTGKEIADIDGRIASQSSSGGLNKKNNSLNVTFTKEGVPVLTASSERAGLGGLVQDLAPILSMALPFILPGVGAALSSSLAGMGGSSLAAGSLANQALTQGILSGGLSTLGGGKFEKGFLSGAISPVVSTGISNMLPTGINTDLARTLTSAGTGAVRGALQGGDFSDILKGGITSGLADYGVNTALGASGLTPQQLNFITGIAAPLLQGDKINPVTAFGALANASQQRAAR